MQNSSDCSDNNPDASQWRGLSAQDDLSADLGRTLLSRLLDNTNDPSTSRQGVSSEELAAINGVGERYRGQPLSLSPVTVDLVRAALGGWFDHAQRSDHFVVRMAERIATTLYDDPESHRRLQQLWIRISPGEGSSTGAADA